ncbi:MAG TPA: anthranilate phosphoribosyltransferase [Verrucomicrobiota bacterium]|nr:anthranilate phosphoribosyltransferase [Verrucomicrobiota bacterium]
MRRVLEAFTRQLRDQKDLTTEQVGLAVTELVSESVCPETKADFLSALAQKGETPDEILAFARALRAMAIVPPVDAETRARGVLDVVGTGGDHAGTFNMSTGAAILCAAGGVTVAKHGNRAVTSQTGSADVLEALGIPIDLSPADAAVALRELRFTFFFAPRYHPAFKQIGPARRLCADRGQRTLFNYLGPLLNPAQPTAQLMGVPKPELCEPLAIVLRALGVRRGMVVCGRVEKTAGGPASIDEVSTLGPTVVAEFYEETDVHVTELAPQFFAVQQGQLADLRGGSREENSAILIRLLRGEEKGPKRDALLLNAGAAFFAAGHVRSISEGWEYGSKLIDSGAAAAKLEELRTYNR